MENEDLQRQLTSRAIAIAAAAYAQPGSPKLVVETVRGYLAEGVSELAIVGGLANLVIFLLARLETLAGRNPLEELRYLAEQCGER
jgi:hypothetical protein